jgi:hypothetical protein
MLILETQRVARIFPNGELFFGGMKIEADDALSVTRLSHQIPKRRMMP